jgi:hypothetical protein
MNAHPTWAASLTDLRDQAVRLMKRRNWHGLCRCCDGQSKANSDQPEHGILHDSSRMEFLEARTKLRNH